MWRSRLHDAAPAGYRVPPRPVEAFPYPLPLSRESVAITSTFSREATIPRSSTFLREATGPLLRQSCTIARLGPANHPDPYVHASRTHAMRP